MNIRSHNPVFRRALNSEYAREHEVATYKGVAFKTLFYLLLVVGGGALTGIFLLEANPNALAGALVFASFGGFIAAIIAIMAPRASKIAGSIYCILQGMLVGVISLFFLS